MTMNNGRRPRLKRWPNGATLFDQEDVLGVGATPVFPAGQVILNWDIKAAPPGEETVSAYVRRVLSPDEAEKMARRLMDAAMAVRAESAGRARYEEAGR